MNGLPNAYYGYSSPPDIYKNLAIIGSRVQEAPSKGAAGDVRAWDIITGKLAWTFHSIPRPGEKFHETWEDDGWKQRSGVNVWNMLTIDAKRGIAYLPFGAPTFDRYGGDHKGANLFSDSLVAVDANTGKYLWHYQVVHHDIWDYDLDTPPVLLEVNKGRQAHSRHRGDEQERAAVHFESRPPASRSLASPRHRCRLRRCPAKTPRRPSPFPTSRRNWRAAALP
jgi:quinoprotein glucose dehydrogenase